MVQQVHANFVICVRFDMDVYDYKPVLNVFHISELSYMYAMF